MNNSVKIHAKLVDITKRTINPSEIWVENGKIKSIQPSNQPCPYYALCGFVDAHVHIESSLLVPSEFARLAVLQGTVATVSDPHEIGNVLGLKGVQFMLDNAQKVPFKFFFGAPSCVPATSFETAGATISLADIETLFVENGLKYLSEMMNYPAVLAGDREVWDKIELAKRLNRKIDGHAPALRGIDAKKYIDAGISTDHECFTEAEAREKLELGMKILIREGSAARNFDALVGLIPEYADRMMFCADDKHPDNLLEGYINQLAARAVAKGCDVFDVLRVACINPVEHYGLEVGQLRVGDAADFILLEDLVDFKVLQTYINGELVADNGKTLIPSVPCEPINFFVAGKKHPTDFELHAGSSTHIKVIEALDGQLVTNRLNLSPKVADGKIIADLERDILKITVVNRYEKDAKPAVAFIKNFGLKKGALASSVAHDSHNVIAVGTNDADLAAAVNLIISAKGGLAAVAGGEKQLLPLPVAGLMSAEDGYKVAQKYADIDLFAKKVLGSTLASPFMSLSFMALLVIPQLKLSDKGLFDGIQFNFVGLS